MTQDTLEDRIAARPAEKVTMDRILGLIRAEEYLRAKCAETLTICVLVLANGFSVIGESACASPENYDEAIGQELAKKDAIRKIWALEGYSLRDRLAAGVALDG